ncbi:MAG: hypothetical protein C4K58_02090 [Flavobacteriaceae bacterium]|nr:MAG: hypothetical protein C4K58_02090 [Flavobacteriaceae bacterium]
MAKPNYQILGKTKIPTQIAKFALLITFVSTLFGCKNTKEDQTKNNNETASDSIKTKVVDSIKTKLEDTPDSLKVDPITPKKNAKNKTPTKDTIFPPSPPEIVPKVILDPPIIIDPPIKKKDVKANPLPEVESYPNPAPPEVYINKPKEHDYPVPSVMEEPNNYSPDLAVPYEKDNQ